jgi:3-hydroxyacyl-[acyl-carrier-protein] dehydratase
MSEQKIYDVTEIMNVLPHRFPMLLVDRVTEVNDNGGKGFKNVTINEDFFNGHFPGAPVMPGVLIVEGMAQCAGFIALKMLEAQGKVSEGGSDIVIYFMTIDGVKFRKPVKPGDRLDYNIEVIKMSESRGKFKGYATVDGEACAEAEMMAMWVSKDKAK